MDHSNAQSLRYAVYARAATDLAHETSITNQVNACIAAAAASNPKLTLSEDCTFTDVGASGTDRRRPGLLALLEKAAQQPRPFDYVFTTDSARISRDMTCGLSIIETLSKNGIAVHFVSPDLRSDDPKFRVVMGFLTTFDQDFSRCLGAKIQRRLRANASDGYSTGGRCYGYASHPNPHSGQGTKLGIVESEASIIRRIYADFSRGVPAPAIARALNAEQVPGPSIREPGRGKHFAWSSRLVYSILRQPRYRGDVRWGRTRRMRHPLTNEVMVSRVPNHEVLRLKIPELVIVSPDLAKAVDERLRAISRRSVKV